MARSPMTICLIIKISTNFNLLKKYKDDLATYSQLTVVDTGLGKKEICLQTCYGPIFINPMLRNNLCFTVETIKYALVILKIFEYRSLKLNID
ncbi:hypothetical protein KUTeg_008701 [Tegillarca granosa]|uniref:Uncharacterized protein n=1 Tax=Tegillarca granosa TaxID=220873 RepID=A0ABQ9FCY2_TEGGR|nr:hypothetical protein KUTeg_008701 [Tegillarca granosa]